MIWQRPPHSGEPREVFHNPRQPGLERQQGDDGGRHFYAEDWHRGRQRLPLDRFRQERFGWGPAVARGIVVHACGFLAIRSPRSMRTTPTPAEMNIKTSHQTRTEAGRAHFSMRRSEAPPVYRAPPVRSPRRLATLPFHIPDQY